MRSNHCRSNNYRISGIFMDMLKKYAKEKKMILEGKNIRTSKTQISIKHFSASFALMAKCSEDANFGLHMGERYYSALSGGVLAGLLANSPNVGQAIDNLCRYHNLMGDYFRLRFDRNRYQGILFWQLPEESRRLDRHIIEGIICNVALTLRRLTNDELQIAEIRFSHLQPQDIREHQRLFGCRCCFGQPVNALVLKTEELKRPVFSADFTLLHKLERIAQKTLKTQLHTEWTRRAMQCINSRLLSNEPCTLIAIASELAVSPRLLQNKLKNEGVSFQLLLDQVRKKMALAYLQKSDMSLFDIAYLLGFAEQSAFNHAFKRWTGAHPGKYKR
jgi:AraC-like DNA-binding protein